MKLRKPLAALLMAATMTITALPLNALAVETTDTDTESLCEHHPEHTAECGYSEGTPVNILVR